MANQKRKPAHLAYCAHCGETLGEALCRGCVEQDLKTMPAEQAKGVIGEAVVSLRRQIRLLGKIRWELDQKEAGAKVS